MSVVIERVEGVWVFPLEDYVCAGVRHHAGTDVDLILHKEDFTAAARVGLGAEHRAFIVSLVEESARVTRVAATNDSTLLAEFWGGEGSDPDWRRSLEVPAGEYEEWEVEGAGFFAVAERWRRASDLGCDEQGVSSCQRQGG